MNITGSTLGYSYVMSVNCVLVVRKRSHCSMNCCLYINLSIHFVPEKNYCYGQIPIFHNCS